MTVPRWFSEADSDRQQNRRATPRSRQSVAVRLGRATTDMPSASNRAHGTHEDARQLELVVHLGGGLDADVQVPREVFRDAAAQPSSNVAGDRFTSAPDLGRQVGEAGAWERVGRGADVEDERVGPLPDHEPAEVLHGRSHGDTAGSPPSIRRDGAALAARRCQDGRRSALLLHPWPP
jgi:hypothetical protein